jgi:hypothetical protein
MDMDTKERRDVERPPVRRWNGALIATAAFVFVIMVGLATVLLSNRDGGEPAAPLTTTVPTTTAGVESTDVGAADPIQAVNDQASRVTITFAGDARALAEGEAHIVGTQLNHERSNDLNPEESRSTS